jgi:hypothetical protein
VVYLLFGDYRTSFTQPVLFIPTLTTYVSDQAACCAKEFRARHLENIDIIVHAELYNLLYDSGG